MAFTRLVDGWNRTRRQRTPLPWGRRVASMESQLGADMTPGREARWERLAFPDDHDHDQQESVMSEPVDRRTTDLPGATPGIRYPEGTPDQGGPDWEAWARDVADAEASGYPRFAAEQHAEVMRDERADLLHDECARDEQPPAFEPYLTTLPDGSHYLVEEHTVPAEHARLPQPGPGEHEVDEHQVDEHQPEPELDDDEVEP